MLKPSEHEKILNRHCDSRSGICHTTAEPTPYRRGRTQRPQHIIERRVSGRVATVDFGWRGSYFYSRKRFNA
jgi:hypothetical protein